MANATTQEAKDWERYKALKRGLKFFNWESVGGLDADLRELAVLERTYPHFEATWRASEEGKRLPLRVSLGGKRKRTRKGKKRYTHNATQSHRRVKA